MTSERWHIIGKPSELVSNNQLGPKAAAFITALEALCREHAVRLTVSDDDGLQVWDMREDCKTISSAGIDDMTTT